MHTRQQFGYNKHGERRNNYLKNKIDALKLRFTREKQDEIRFFVFSFSLLEKGCCSKSNGIRVNWGAVKDR